MLTLPAGLPQAFGQDGAPEQLTEIGQGHIHLSYIARYPADTLLHQRLNSHVFSDPYAVQENISRVTTHLRRQADYAYQTLELIHCRDGRPCWQSPDGEYWRSYRYIANSMAPDRIDGDTMARDCGMAFGEFIHALSDLDPATLRITISDFHRTDKIHARLYEAVEKAAPGRRQQAGKLLGMIDEHAGLATLLSGHIDRGELPLRVGHNDTKVNNLLFDRQTGRPIAVIDLDTVMAGYVPHDFGDLVRSALTGRDGHDKEARHQLFAALARGFIQGCGTLLNETEFGLLARAPALIAFELGIRFLTDYLENDQYFKTRRAGHNLQRAGEQLALMQILEQEHAQLTALLEQARTES